MNNTSRPKYSSIYRMLTIHISAMHKHSRVDNDFNIFRKATTAILSLLLEIYKISIE